VTPLPAVKPNQPVTVTATDYQPGSRVTVTQTLTTRERTAVRTTVRVPVTVKGRRVMRSVQRTTYVPKPVTRSVLLATFPVSSQGGISGRVLPRAGAPASVLTLRGQDRGGRPVSVTTPLRIG
jgi:hypothetical protein